MKYVKPCYVVPSRNQFTADINLKHATYKQRLKEKLGSSIYIFNHRYMDKHSKTGKTYIVLLTAFNFAF